MVSEHRVSFLVSDAARCGRGPSLARPAGPGNGISAAGRWVGVVGAGRDARVR
jgi:hypothetical protein